MNKKRNGPRQARPLQKMGTIHIIHLKNEREQSPERAEDYRQGLSEAQPLIKNMHD